ncbi:MAG: creatininase family protein [Solirubrobacterales bacterium]|nr:creatininase family protein [Solirubrobacterales bacterium]
MTPATPMAPLNRAAPRCVYRAMEQHLMERMTWTEVDATLTAGVDAVLLPFGSVEQHGPHMPLDTDCFIAGALALRAAQRAAQDGLRLLVAPTVNVTLSWYHMQYPGSMRLRTQTFLSVFRDVCDSLFEHGIRTVVIVNGHGGNVAALTVAINDYLAATGRRITVANWLELAADVVGELTTPATHAEEAETSLAMALGQRVDMDLAVCDAFERSAAVHDAGLPWTSLGRYDAHHRGPSAIVPMDMLRDISPSGVVGDARRATVETGERILEVVVPRLVQLTRELSQTAPHPDQEVTTTWK